MSISLRGSAAAVFLSLVGAGGGLQGSDRSLQQRTPQQAGAPVAIATLSEATYCFAQNHSILLERIAEPALVLRLRLHVDYHNDGVRPLIVPVERERTVFTAIKPGVMKKAPGGSSFFDPLLKEMKTLPADVSSESPVEPANEVFTVIAPKSDMKPALDEDVLLPIYGKAALHGTDLRGRRLYVKLQYKQQPLFPPLEADLSDRWSRFGVPWTGILRTNTLVIDIPAHPAAHPCK